MGATASCDRQLVCQRPGRQQLVDLFSRSWELVKGLTCRIYQPSSPNTIQSCTSNPLSTPLLLSTLLLMSSLIMAPALLHPSTNPPIAITVSITPPRTEM